MEERGEAESLTPFLLFIPANPISGITEEFSRVAAVS